MIEINLRKEFKDGLIRQGMQTMMDLYRRSLAKVICRAERLLHTKQSCSMAIFAVSLRATDCLLGAHCRCPHCGLAGRQSTHYAPRLTLLDRIVLAELTTGISFSTN